MTTAMPRYWKPLRLTEEFMPLRPELIAETMKAYAMDEPTARKLLDEEHAKCRYWINDLYQIQTRQLSSGIMHICIRRRDGSMFKDWRHFQQIKNEVAGPEREAIELYPRESRLVDTSNKWHLWVMPEGTSMDGVGWTKRDVSYEENRHVPGLRQRTL